MLPFKDSHHVVAVEAVVEEASAVAEVAVEVLAIVEAVEVVAEEALVVAEVVAVEVVVLLVVVEDLDVGVAAVAEGALKLS